MRLIPDARRRREEASGDSSAPPCGETTKEPQLATDASGLEPKGADDVVDDVRSAERIGWTNQGSEVTSV